MEGEVKEIQMELAAIKKDRLDLYNRKLSTGLVVSVSYNCESGTLTKNNYLVFVSFKLYIYRYREIGCQRRVST